MVWRKLKYKYADSPKIQTMDWCSKGNFDVDLFEVKKYLRSLGRSFVYLSKTLYNTFDEPIKL